jgi:hypothetical protein
MRLCTVLDGHHSSVVQRQRDAAQSPARATEIMFNAHHPIVTKHPYYIKITFTTPHDALLYETMRQIRVAQREELRQRVLKYS